MQIIAAIEYDRLRKEPENWNKVILHREGKFYRAYEWSAWLIKPHRTYMSHHAEQRLCRSVERLPMNKPDKLFRSVNAMLGVLAHYDSYRLRHELFDTDAFHRVGYFDRDIKQFFLR